MLATGKMTSKFIFVYAHMTADVALEWMFIAMAAHMNSVQDIVRKVHLAVLAFVEEMHVLRSPSRGWCARLAVADTRSESVQAALKVQARNRAARVVARVGRLVLAW